LNRIKNYLVLVRPANIVTSVADVLAGMAIAGIFIDRAVVEDKGWQVLLLSLSTIGLYAGGIVFNDVFDAELDKMERPERPIPSGKVSLQAAIVLGIVLLATGIAAALAVSLLAGSLALAIAVFALLYDKFSKHHAFAGPLNMGICRGLNLLLGISIIPAALYQWPYLALVPLIYIFSITMISQGEVHGGDKNKLYTAFLLYTLVVGAILLCAILQDEIIWALVMLAPFCWMIFPALVKAIQQPVALNIRKAVKSGVIGLILMDAAWAAAFHSWYAALFMAALLPLSAWLGKQFAVT
jgi:4-hydroxybenzoate polyprenyltransferase